MKKRYVLAFDAGTTSSRAILFNDRGEIDGTVQKEFPQIYPKPGWVEHDPEDIWATQILVAEQVLRETAVSPDAVAAIGITNQRETTLVWNRNTGKPVYNAIVWQDRRTASICEELKKQGYEDYIRTSTGLVVDAYFSGTKIAWILRNIKGSREAAERGDLLFGTVDTWLLWRLTNGAVHATDATNASRTMLYNIEQLTWDEKLLKALDIPTRMMPEVRPSAFTYGETAKDFFSGIPIPIAGIAGDQQAALFG